MSGKTLLYKFISFIIRPFVISKYNLTGDDIDIPKGANLILSNHVTNLDFLFIVIKSKGTYMNFVIAENAFRNVYARTAINALNNPIIHVKGASSLNTIKDITKCIKKGNNAMLFPEGNTSFDGSTKVLDDSIGKLVKLCSANLVLIKIEGGYLSRPRWGTSFRKGAINMKSTCVSLDNLKKLSVSEITDMVNSNLYTNAYEEQENHKIEFNGKKTCLGLERAIYLCPKCEKYSVLCSNDSFISCSCGYKALYDNCGYLTDDSGKTFSIKEHLDYQKNYLRTDIYNTSCDSVGTYIEKSQDTAIFTDTVSVNDVTDNQNIISCGQIKIEAYKDKAIYEFIDKSEDSFIINYSEIRNVVVFKANTLSVIVCVYENEKRSDRVYEIKGDFSFNALKYRDLFEIINE